MSTLDFINSIGYNVFINSVVEYFDYIMALYNICKGSSYSDIATAMDGNIAIFTLSFPTMDDAVSFAGGVYMQQIKIYDRIFNIESNIMDSNIPSVMIKIYPSA